IVIVVTGLVIRRSRQVSGDKPTGRICWLTCQHSLRSALKPVSKAGCRRYLIPVRFPRRRAYVIPKAQSQCERRLQSPLILCIYLVFVTREPPTHRIALRRCRTCFVKIVKSRYVADRSQQLRQTVVKAVRTTSVQGNAETSGLRASRISWLKNRTTGRRPGWVDHKARERVCVCESGVPRPSIFTAKTELMQALRPTDIIAEVMLRQNTAICFV